MAKRNRPSVLKRLRESEKRQRQARKAEKAVQKRERRMQRESEESQLASGQEVSGDGDVPASPAEHGDDRGDDRGDVPAPSSGTRESA